MLKRLLSRLLDAQPLRRWTDQPVACERCNGHLVFTTFSTRNDRWRHADCNYDGTRYVVTDDNMVYMAPNDPSARIVFSSQPA